MVVRAGSSVDVSSNGTSDITGYTVVEDFEFDGEDGVGELLVVKSGASCAEAWNLNFFGSSRGEGPVFEDGHFTVYPAGSGEGWMSKESEQTPEWIFEKYSARSADLNRWYRSCRFVK